MIIKKIEIEIGGIVIKKRFNTEVLLISSILTVFTYICPIFFNVPKWISLNIIGTFLVSYTLGPIVGFAYTGFINLIINITGMGYGINICILFIQSFEAFFIGILKFKKINSIVNIVIISIILSFIFKPMGQIIYIYFTKSAIDSSLKNFYINYVNTKLLTNTFIYVFSGIIAEFISKWIIKLNVRRSN